MRSNTPFAILSAERSELNEAENTQRTGELRAGLTRAGASFVEVNGSYEGRAECSALVILPRGDADPLFETVRNLARSFGQDSVLYVGLDRQACLFFADGALVPLGAWREVDAVAAQAAGAYTELDGHYYTAGE